MSKVWITHFQESSIKRMTYSANMAKNDDEIELLRRKLRETEARVTSRLIISAQQSLPKEILGEFMKQFEGNTSLDLLQMERDISDQDRRENNESKEIVTAAEEYRIAVREYQDDAARAVDSSIQDAVVYEKLEKSSVKQIVKREKLFSLIEESRLRKSMDKRLSGNI